MATEITLSDILGVFMRRRHIVLACALAGVAAASLASRALPRYYKCSTRIEVAAVAGVGSRDLAENARAVQDQLKSRSVFEEVVRDLGLAGDRPRDDGRDPKASRDALVDGLMGATKVFANEAASGVFYISISTAWADAETPFRVCTALANRYKTDVTDRPKEDAEKRVQAAKDEHAKTAESFRKADEELAAFTDANKDILSAGADQQLATIRSEIQKWIEIEIPTMKQRLATAEAQLAVEKQWIEVVNEVRDEVRITEAEKRVSALEAELLDLNAKFTEEHPDVLSAQNKLAVERGKLKKLLDGDGIRKAKSLQENPLWLTATKDRNEAQFAISSAERQVQMNRKNEQEVRMRAEELALLKPRLSTLEQARTVAGTALEERRKALEKAEEHRDNVAKERVISYRVLDEPLKPRSPGGPGALLFAAAGLCAGAALGLVVAYVLNVKDTSFREVDAVTAYLGLPTLGAIHMIETPAEARVARTARHRKIAGFIALGGLALASAVWAIQQERLQAADASERTSGN